MTLILCYNYFSLKDIPLGFYKHFQQIGESMNYPPLYALEHLK